MVIFEDYDKSSISSLLYHVYGRNIVFASGNEKLELEIDKALKRGLDVVCYVDCVPDNPDSVVLYNSLRESYYGNNRVNILNIPCIEFIILQVLINLQVLPKNADTQKFIDSVNGKEIEYSAKSYERFCKGVLNSTKKICLRNEEIKGTIEYWYTGSCDCVGSFSKNCRRFNITQKAAALAFFLPYIEVGDRLVQFVNSGLLRENTISSAKNVCDTWQKMIYESIKVFRGL